MLDIEPGYIIWELISFALFALLLRAFAWKPVAETLKHREDSNRLAIAKAEEAQYNSERALETIRYGIANTNNDVQKLMDQHLALAEEIKTRAIMRANKLAQKILDEARYEIQRYKENAVQKMKIEVGDLAIQLTGIILEQQLDQSRHSKLVDIALNSLPNGTEVIKDTNPMLIKY